MTVTNINRIAVLKLRQIGDTLLATPALRNLRRAFPQAQIRVFAAEGTEEMLQNNDSVNEIIVVQRSGKRLPILQKIRLTVIPYLKMLTGQYDLVLDYTTGDRASFLTALSGAKIRAAFKTSASENSLWKSRLYTHFVEPPPPPTHEVVRHLKLLEAVGIPPCELPLELYPPDDSIQWASAQIARVQGKPVIHFHPVARWLFKCWDDHYAAELIQRLVDQLKAQVVITSSSEPKELARIDGILGLADRTVLNLAGKTTLMQTAAISKASDLFVGVDTAPMHMAAAVGTPVVCLFGPSGVETWFPWSKKTRVMHHGCHCNESGVKTCPHDSVRDCLKSITVDEVFQAIIGLLGDREKATIHP